MSVPPTLPPGQTPAIGAAHLASTANPTSPFLRQMQQDLTTELVHELELTMRVAVMTAGGMTRRDIIATLQRDGIAVDELDVKMATKRLTKLAGDWRA